MDEIIAKEAIAAPDAAESPLDKKRREDRERKRLKRAEKRAKESADQSLEARIEIIKKQWQRNIEHLSAKASRDLSQRAEDFEYIEGDLCHTGASRMNRGEVVGQDEGGYGTIFEPDVWAKEVSEFAAKFPPVDYPVYDYLNLKSQGYYFQNYGMHLDGISEMALHNFQHYYAKWTEAHSKPPVVREQPEPPVAPILTPEESAARALEDVRKFGVNYYQ